MSGMYTVPCWTCEGTGQVRRPVAIVLLGSGGTVTGSTRCRSCNGTGQHVIRTQR